MLGFGYTFQFSPIDTGALLPAGACFVYKKTALVIEAVSSSN